MSEIWRGMGAPLDWLRDGAYALRFLATAPPLLRRPLAPHEARTALCERLNHREASFLNLAARAIYCRPRHPYRRLLDHAGCEFGDLAKLVNQNGLEDGLRALFLQGVYLTVGEFKRRQPIVRGGLTFTIDPADLLNPLAAQHLVGETGGSRGVRAPAPFDLWRLREEATPLAILFDAIRTPAWKHGVWTVPGSLPLALIIIATIAGLPVERWFHQVDPGAPGLPARYRLSSPLLRVAGRFAGVPIPPARVVPTAHPAPVLDWMVATLRAGGVPHLHTNTSAAVLLCETATAAGLDLTGARFLLCCEPATSMRQAIIRQAGATALAFYGTMDAGLVGQACDACRLPDEMHLLDDLFGIIQPGDASLDVPGLTPRSLLCTTLRARAPYLLLNASLGDQAEVMPARCDGPLTHAGWTRQLRAVQSHEKINAGGLTLLDIDVVHVLEEVLPGRFGGGPLDYQLVESLDGDGRAEVRLLVHPRLGPIDADRVADAFLGALSGNGADRVRQLQWQRGGVLTVERAAPRSTPAGKILHMHQDRVVAEATADRDGR